MIQLTDKQKEAILKLGKSSEIKDIPAFGKILQIRRFLLKVIKEEDAILWK